MSVILACDIGSTRFRAALVDRQGVTLAQHSIQMTSKADSNGHSEVDPDLWWCALSDCATALFATVPTAFSTIDAIAISGITRSQVLIGEDLRAIRPAILWNDVRAGETLASLLAICPPDHPEISGLNAFHPAARLWWLKNTDPTQFQLITAILDPKDYLNLRLTGIPASDPVSMARLITTAAPGTTCPSLFDAAGIPASLIPTVHEPVSIMGRVQLDLGGVFDQLAGAPVITMANDTWAGVVGLGAMRPGFAYNLTGTTEVLGLVSTIASHADGLLSVDWRGGLTQLGGPSQCGGDTLAWLLELVGIAAIGGASTRLDHILRDVRDADPVLFLPYLQGERVPYWDTALRGAIVGLNRRHRAVDLVFAVMEGVGFLNRHVLDRAEASVGMPTQEIRFGGGGSANPIWCQIKADILGRPIAVVDNDEVGLLGAAIAAFTALRYFPDLDHAQGALVRVGKTYIPNLKKHSDYNRLFALFCETEAALQPISTKLAGWREGVSE